MGAPREPRRVWESIGYLRGDAEAFLETRSAQENLRYQASLKRVPAAVLDREVALQLERAGLQSQATAPPRSFERDDRLRLAMAQACIDNPRLLLLDDPLLGVGPDAADEFLATFEQWLAPVAPQDVP